MTATPSTRPPIILIITSIIFALVGLYFGIGGVWLAALGGSLYYVITGIAILVTAFLVWRRRASAFWLYAAVMLGTLIWAISEAGFDFWKLAPRGDVIAPLGVWLLLPFVGNKIIGKTAKYALGATIVLAIITLGVAMPQDAQAIRGNVADNAKQPPGNIASTDWTSYGGTNAADRFSGLDQITPANVGKLKLAWQFETGDIAGPNDSGQTTYENTPLKVGDTVYACTPHDLVFAIDAATGKKKWEFDPHVVDNRTFQHLTCRGVGYHETQPGATTLDGQPAPQDCPRRLFLPTATGLMYAINADDGKLCENWGDHGVVDLKYGSPYQTNGFYSATSPPIVGSQVLVMGGAVIDNWSKKVPSGAIRAYDVYSGKLVWVFDAGNPEVNEMPSATHQLTAGSPNSWMPGVIDEKLGMVYLPMGQEADDIWGGNRSPYSARYDSSLVALDLKTGHVNWSFQTVHHDLWDMDLPSQPSLADVQTKDGVVPAIYAPAKTGNIFVLNRATGQLVVPAPETAVPTDGAPGDHVAPTQPFSELSFRPRKKLTGADMWGATAFDQLACRIMFHQLKYEGPFTPPSVQGTLVFPGNYGTFEWGGVSIDQADQIMIANPQYIPFVSHLRPRGPHNPATPTGSVPAGTETGVQPMFGAAFGVNLHPFLSPVGVPCLAPSWGNMAAIDLRTNKVIWEHRVGSIQDETPIPLPFNLGTPMLGGPLATAGGVTFVTSTLDYYIRAFNMKSGDLLWTDRLPAGGQSTPMTYSEKGKQYILTVDGGDTDVNTKLGDYIRAYALPDGS
ncbi:membrane-bound PQQ-dependent dehydrogenase, glucose/quinate/shikimate family [Acidisoma cellulosilytica]|uniref:Membrane-bound PQQ-dependent dehydrogenase, glucose/quinate/shikimate family n=1 Tax=Acidisoma cellulosilyticum TaxID=2802395 RepID=A0A963YYT0_9PROT|nr:membrane-bound PQQ-dependent dehydrogenase, glucose/quinate/shikimate family [Acidisoma cellulosilyticum]MCB8878832.1 membrane-bound PQQ-dependent dehydrogenase, glucose/quinate/shikimate family [Acidisoma cellulosilyticum]